LNTVTPLFSTLMELANRHNLKALHEMFWQSPSALLVAKLHNIARSGPVMLQPDFSKLKVVGLTHDLANPMRR
jgi:hypothetical protein